MKHMECVRMKNVILNTQLLYIYRTLFICHIIYIEKSKGEREKF